MPSDIGWFPARHESEQSNGQLLPDADVDCAGRGPLSGHESAVLGLHQTQVARRRAALRSPFHLYVDRGCGIRGSELDS